MQQKYTIRDFERDFPDDDACLEWVKNLRWPDGIECRQCERVTKHYKVSGRRGYACEFCGSHVYPLAGTIIEHSPTSLCLWFRAIFLMAATRCGISAKQLQREIGVTYKCAWRMFGQIRSMLDDEIMDLLGEVEIDESYFGGHRRGKGGRGAAGKTIVLGMAERRGRIVATVIPNAGASSILPVIKTHVMPESMVYTDEFGSYAKLRRHGYQHKRIHHSANVYVRGNVSTNTVESFWSICKRGISGVHHVVGANKLQGYLNAYAWRWNHRNDETPMFLQMLARLAACLRDGAQPSPQPRSPSL